MSSAGTTAAEGAAAAAATTTTAEPAKWFSGFEAEDQSFLLNKGWTNLEKDTAFKEMLKSYKNAETKIGTPAEQLVRLPKDAADTEGWKAFNAKIGVPEKPEGYDFTGLKFSDGTELDDDFVNSFRAAFHEEGVPAGLAKGVMEHVVKYMESAETDETAAKQAAIAQGRDELARSWGANAEANKFIAQQAVLKLGLTPDFVQKIENEAGYAQTMQTLLKLGQMMGEDKFVANHEGPAKGVLTREQAEARLGELKRDSTWVGKVNAGDHKANDEFNALTRIIAMGTGA